MEKIVMEDLRLKNQDWGLGTWISTVWIET